MAKLLFKGKLLKIEQEATRGHEIVRHPGAVAVIPVLGDNPHFHPDRKIILCSQWRPAVATETNEIVAGTRDVEGELPIDTAIRELHEEIQMNPARQLFLGEIFPSPGYSSEVIQIFVAWGLTPWDGPKHEIDIMREITVGEVLTMIRRAQLCDAKTIAAMLLWQNADL